MNTKFKTAFLIGIMLVFAACSARISTEIYLADLDELNAINSEMTTVVLIGLPIGSEDDCVEDRQRYNGVFRQSTHFKNMEFVRCYSESYDDFAEYELEVPLRLVDPAASTIKGPFEIIRHDDSTSNVRTLYLRSNPRALCNLDDLIRDEFYQSLDLSDTSPLIQITNDLRASQTLVFNQVFVNEAPVIEPTAMVLDRRDTVQIALSDVTSAWVFSKACNVSSRLAPVGVWVGDE